MRPLSRIFLALLLSTALGVPAHAEEFYCEVMALEGTATLTNDTVSGKALQEGDVLKAEDVIQVGAGSYLDLAYDREWNNVTRVEENSKIRIRSLDPAEVELESGGIYAKLQSLPKESTFNISTPTAIASVRGTEYRTTFLEGETQIYNVSDSDVYVYGLDTAGKPQAAPVIIRRSETTQVAQRGRPPVAPRKMEAQELKRAENFHHGIEKHVQENIAKGRVGKIQDIHAIEKAHLEHPKAAGTRMDTTQVEHPKAVGARLETPQEGAALVSREGEPAQTHRNIPKIISGDEARQAAQHVTGDEQEAVAPAATQRQAGEAEHGPQPQGQESRPVQSEEGMSRLLQSPEETHAEMQNRHDEKAGHEVTDADLGPPPSQEQLKEAVRGIQAEDGSFDRNKIEQLRKKVNDAIESSSPEQKEMLLNMQKQVHETVQKVMQQRSQQGQSGQPFGPDPGRRPQDGSHGASGENRPKANAPAKPGARGANHQ